ncbi:unnamed protein product [Didymodactylos carnosus]|uniref:Uncharacterized protein n=1 Tax=Didymodactylos carnosus TaxID=1234261 RepID=A0A815A9I2_9BILA|nr:unnamed protein product [Didymodactylos carnosus]CAF4024969.1 unnamed protein product [Didymodactylos carnosus]
MRKILCYLSIHSYTEEHCPTTDITNYTSVIPQIITQICATSALIRISFDQDTKRSNPTGLTYNVLSLPSKKVAMIVKLEMDCCIRYCAHHGDNETEVRVRIAKLAHPELTFKCTENEMRKDVINETISDVIKKQKGRL